MDYNLIKDSLRDISFEFKGKGLEKEADFIINDMLLFVNKKYYQQTSLNRGHKISIAEKPTEPFKGIFDKSIFDKSIFDNIATPKKWCTNKLCYCTGDCQRMIKVPVELENLDLLFNITARSEQFNRNSISKALNKE